MGAHKFKSKPNGAMPVSKQLSVEHLTAKITELEAQKQQHLDQANICIGALGMLRAVLKEMHATPNAVPPVAPDPPAEQAAVGPM